MSPQRTTEWIEKTEEDVTTFQQQFKTPYRSTVFFCDWLEKQGCLTSSTRCRIVDIGAGMGETLSYMARRFPRVDFLGIELNQRHVERGNRMLRQVGLTNATLVTGDLFNLGQEHRNRYEGVVSIQTLSWLPESKAPLEHLMALNPKWIALTSLFFDGEINARIEIQDYTSPKRGKPYREAFYNVYSIPHVKQLFVEHGYHQFEYEPFHIDIDLPRPVSPQMGTYTVKLETGERLQLSGPLLMSWYFIVAKAEPSAAS